MNNNDDESDFLSWDGTGGNGSIVNPPPVASISISNMDNGRDEMNLAEFPLAGLANRSPKGKDTLVFEDCTWDRQQRANVRKRLTVTASAEFGLPTALDDETILGLVQLAKASQFTDRQITFVPAELFRLLGWREEGRSYSRLETSLKRWLGVTLYYDQAWWDKEHNSWVDEHFHLLDNVTVRRRPRKGATHQRRPWSITWNEVMFRSCQAGYLKRLDMSVYRQLGLAAAKRMYRFLDKRFYFTNRLTFDLRTFACEHIGFRRGDDNSQLKRRLNRAIDQLEQVGFIEPVSEKARYRKVCHGRWEVVFLRSATKATKPSKRTSDPREADLVKRGIRQPVAARLVREHPESSIHAAVKQFDQLIQRGQHTALDNPPGLLVAWIREHSESSALKANEPENTSVDRRPQDHDRLAEIRKREAEKKSQARMELDAIRNHLGKLSSEELQSLELDALSQANPFQLQCYRRSHADGNADMLQKYREIIVEDHVRMLLGLSSK